MRWFVLAGSLIAALTGLAGAAAQTEPRRSTSPVVLELFTSQGCSSCPPADALLGEFANRRDVIALAYHVDYWDSLGWRDPFAIPQAAKRQRQYAASLKLATVFTPQLIIGGRESVIGSDRKEILASLDDAAVALPIKAAVVGDVLVVSLDARTGGPLDVSAVSYLPEASTAIGRGENGGRTLKEFNVVRSVAFLGVWDGTEKTFSLPLRSLPADASRVAVLAQAARQGSVVGAVNVILR